MGSTLRVGICRHASRVYGSGSARPFHVFPQNIGNAGAFSGLVKNSKVETHFDLSTSGNLCMKLGLVRVAENVCLPCGLSFRSSIHSGEPREAEEERPPRLMDSLQGIRQEVRNGQNERHPLYSERGRTMRSMDSLQGLRQEMGNGNEQKPLFSDRGRTLRSMDYDQGLRQKTGNDVNEPPQLFSKGGRAPRSMDYVQGLLNEEIGNDLNGRIRHQTKFVDGVILKPTYHFPGLPHERGTGLGGQSPLYNPTHYESNADVVHIKLARNNSFVTLTDFKGNKKIGISAAIAAGKGDKPSRYSAEAASEYIGSRVRQMKTRSVVVKVSGHTFFRRKRDAILAFKDGYTSSRGNMNPIVHIEDTTRKPHNGCRRPKKRRI